MTTAAQSSPLGPPCRCGVTTVCPSGASAEVDSSSPPSRVRCQWSPSGEAFKGRQAPGPQRCCPRGSAGRRGSFVQDWGQRFLLRGIAAVLRSVHPERRFLVELQSMPLPGSHSYAGSATHCCSSARMNSTMSFWSCGLQSFNSSVSRRTQQWSHEHTVHGHCPSAALKAEALPSQRPAAGELTASSPCPSRTRPSCSATISSVTCG